MTPEQKAAYVVAQAALLNARISAMKAENDCYPDAIPYGEKAFDDVIEQFDGILGHNALMELFKD